MLNDYPCQDTQMTALHELRHQRLLNMIKSTGVEQVLDLGCGSGSFIWYLLQEPRFSEVVGLESSEISLMQARQKLADYLVVQPARTRLICGSYSENQPSLVDFAMAVMIETIEHNPLRDLSKIEQNVFSQLKPRQLIMTTPNADYNPIYGLSAGQYRDPDHKFEWGRAKFRQWAGGIARRHGYKLSFSGIGEPDPELGHPTQLAWFVRHD